MFTNDTRISGGTIVVIDQKSGKVKVIQCSTFVTNKSAQRDRYGGVHSIMGLAGLLKYIE